jgi:hypothetical protein
MPGDAVLEDGGKSMAEDIKQKSEIDSQNKYEIMTPEEVAQFLKKSTSWVYKNWQVLGGRKLGGSLFFPRKEELYEHLFSKREEMEIRLHSDREQVHKSGIHNKGKSQKSRSKKKGGNKKSEIRDDPNRHNIFGTGK